jgi:DNA-binding MltR family transcriptional regulator
MPNLRALHDYLNKLRSGRSQTLVPLRIPATDFPQGAYDPHYDFVRLFLRDTERGAALSMVSALEVALTNEIKASIEQDNALHQEMFRDGGPLGNLGTKIKLGFLLKLYSKDTMDDLGRIARIRNLFAHELDAHDFSHQRIRGLTEALTLTKRAAASDDVLIKSVYDQVLKHLADKDLGKTYFAFMANLVFVASYLASRRYLATEHGPELLAHCSIF